MKRLEFSLTAKNNVNVVLTNTFITDYLAFAPGDYVKIYIYCILECNRQNENWYEDLKTALSLNDKIILDAFKYWEEAGLVQITDSDNLQITFMEVKETKGRIKYSRGKYAEFNKQIKELFVNRELTPLELNEYYTIMEEFNIQPEALIMIIKYCMDRTEDKNIHKKYVLNVARDWATSGIISVEQVEKKLADQTKLNKNINKIFKALSLQKEITAQDIELFNKWTTEYNYSAATIVQAIRSAGNIKSLRRLDEVLEELYSQNITTGTELENYFEGKNRLIELAITINKNLSYHDSNIDNVIEIYIKPWQSMGYSSESLIIISKYCYKCAKKSLFSMNNYIEYLYKTGRIESEDIIEHIRLTQILKQEFQDLLFKYNIGIPITDSNLSCYNTWKNIWNFKPELIDYAISLAQGADRPIRYINILLNSWKNANIDNIISAKNFKLSVKTDDDIKTASFSDKDFEHLFMDLDNVELNG